MNGERRPAGRGTALTAFTARGTVLAEALAAALDGHLRTEDEMLANWARRSFAQGLRTRGWASCVSLSASGCPIRMKRSPPAQRRSLRIGTLRLCL